MNFSIRNQAKSNSVETEDKKVRRFRKLKDRLRYKLEMKIFYLFLENYLTQIKDLMRPNLANYLVDLESWQIQFYI